MNKNILVTGFVFVLSPDEIKDVIMLLQEDAISRPE